LALVQGDENLKVWDLATGQELRDFQYVQARHPAFSPDGKHLVAAAVNGTIFIWDLSATVRK
jgi:WD40 repeat protein